MLLVLCVGGGVSCVSGQLALLLVLLVASVRTLLGVATDVVGAGADKC